MSEDLKELATSLSAYLHRGFSHVPHQEIEDVVQEVMLRFFTGHRADAITGEYRRKLAFAAAKFRAIDRLRKLRRIQAQEQSQVDPDRLESHSTPPLLESQRAEAVRALHVALVTELSHHERQIIHLRFTEELKLEEIAGRLRVGTATIHRHLIAALNKLRRGLRGYEDLLEGDS